MSRSVHLETKTVSH